MNADELLRKTKEVVDRHPNLEKLLEDYRERKRAYDALRSEKKSPGLIPHDRKSERRYRV